MKTVAEYLFSARYFDRLALAEARCEVKQLLTRQADTCYRLAERRARRTNAPIPLRPIGLWLIPGHETGSLRGDAQPAAQD